MRFRFLSRDIYSLSVVVAPVAVVVAVVVNYTNLKPELLSYPWIWEYKSSL